MFFLIQVKSTSQNDNNLLNGLVNMSSNTSHMRLVVLVVVYLASLDWVRIRPCRPSVVVIQPSVKYSIQNRKLFRKRPTE